MSPAPSILAAALPPASRTLTDVAADWPTWGEVVRTLTLQAGHNTTLVIVGTALLGLAAGVVGVFALLRRQSLMADAMSHATLPGIGLAFLAATALGVEGRSLPVLLAGAATTGVLGMFAVHGLLRFSRLREDAAIGIVLSVFFGAGIVILSLVQSGSNGAAGGLNTFIYGQTAAMSVGDARLMGLIAVAAVAGAVLLFKELALVAFNESFARAGGWPVAAIDVGMMGLVVLVTVAGLQSVGLILVVALLIIPPVAARFWTERLRTMVVLAAGLGAASGWLGAGASALLPRTPAGAVIVLVAGGLFVVSLLVAPARGVIAAGLRRTALHGRIAGEHVVETAWESAPSGALDGPAVVALARRHGWGPFRRRLVLGLAAARGLVRRTAGGGLELTQDGRREGARVSRNHALWEQYLVSYADIAPSHVDWSVDQVEHVLSEPLVAELEAALAARGVAIPAPHREPAA